MVARRNAFGYNGRNCYRNTDNNYYLYRYRYKCCRLQQYCNCNSDS